MQSPNFGVLEDLDEFYFLEETPLTRCGCTCWIPRPESSLVQIRSHRASRWGAGSQSAACCPASGPCEQPCGRGSTPQRPGIAARQPTLTTLWPGRRSLSEHHKTNCWIQDDTRVTEASPGRSTAPHPPPGTARCGWHAASAGTRRQ